MPVAARPLLDRIFEKVTYEFGCWVFTGAKTNGYGVVQRGGRTGTGLVHRLVYEQLVGSVPHDLALDHLCRNPACCNPMHLEPVTLAENFARGVNGGSWQRRKTHCPQGHEYTPENTRRVQPGNRRECRQCGRDHYHRRKAAGHGND